MSLPILQPRRRAATSKSVGRRLQGLGLNSWLDLRFRLLLELLRGIEDGDWKSFGQNVAEPSNAWVFRHVGMHVSQHAEFRYQNVVDVFV